MDVEGENSEMVMQSRLVPGTERFDYMERSLFVRGELLRGRALERCSK